MHKQEALRRAMTARDAAQRAYGVWQSYISLFGPRDSLTLRIEQERLQALEAHDKWMWVAELHPSTRASLIRKQSLPAWMFQYQAA